MSTFTRNFIILLEIGILFPLGIFAAQNVQGAVIVTTEPVPGVECVCVSENEGGGSTSSGAGGKKCSGPIEKRKYECNVNEIGVEGFLAILSGIMDVVVKLAVLLGVLVIAALGIAWVVAGGDDPEYKKMLKDWMFNILVGLIILALFGYILKWIAPAHYF